MDEGVKDMTEETKDHVLDIIAQLSEQYLDIEKLVGEAMQDYGDAAEVSDLESKSKAFNEIQDYVEAYAEVRKAIRILSDAREEY